MQAVLILAHKNIDQVVELCQLLKPYFEIYIHFDKKVELTSQQRTELEKNDVKYYSKYNVKWGSYSIVRATVLLMKKALMNKKINYFHLISGQDWPMQSPEKIYNFLLKW